MISKTDCLNLLFDLQDSGVDCTSEIKHLISLSSPDIEIIKFINSKRELNLRKFYEKLRKSYNDKHSKLYINIVKEDELEPKELVCCLGAFLQQALIFNKSIDDTSFLSHSRMEDVLECLTHYYKTADIIPCQKLIKIIKADLKALEEVSK